MLMCICRQCTHFPSSSNVYLFSFSVWYIKCVCTSIFAAHFFFLAVVGVVVPNACIRLHCAITNRKFFIYRIFGSSIDVSCFYINSNSNFCFFSIFFSLFFYQIFHIDFQDCFSVQFNSLFLQFFPPCSIMLYCSYM